MERSNYNMKRALLILFGVICFIGCSINTKSSYESDDELEYESINYWDDVDTTSYPYSGLCVQVLNNNDRTNSCLATVGFQRTQKENFGKTVCVVSKDVMYDGKFFDGEYIKVGTYEYLGVDTAYHTVLIITNKDDYKFLFKNRRNGVVN